MAALVLLAGLGGTTGVSAQKSDIAVGNATINDTQLALAPAVAVPLLDTSFLDPGLSAERAFVVLTTSNNNKVELPNISVSPCSGDCPQGDVGGGSYLAAALAKAAVAAEGDNGIIAEQAANALVNKGIDELERVLTGYGPIRNIEITYISGRDALPKELRVDTMLALLETSKSTVIGQVGLFDNGSVDSAHNGFNLGVGYRYLINNDDTLIGVNVFYDYLDDPTVSRFSVGGELKGDWYDVSANWYSGVRDGAAANGGRVESADGWDIEMAGRVASVPWLEFSGKYYNFDGLPGRDDQSGTDFGVRFEPIPLVGAEARYNIPEDGSSEFYAAVNLKYRFGVSLAEHLNPQRVQVSPVKHKRYDRVRREYQQRLNQYAPPLSNNVGLSVVSAPGDATGATLRWSWLDLGAAQADVRFGQIPIVDDNYSSPGRDPVARSGTTGATIVEGLIPGITYQFNVRLFATGSATPIMVTGNTVTFTVPGTPPQRSRINARSTVSRIVTGASGTITFDVQPRSANPVTVQFILATTGIAQNYSLTALADSANLITSSSTGGSVEIPANSDSASLNLVPQAGIDASANGIFTLTVVSGSGYNLGDLPSTTVQMVPANTAVASVRASTSSTFEGGTVQFAVALDPAPASPLSLSFSIDGNSISDSDYSISGPELQAGSNTINFAANQASSVVTLTVVDDSDTTVENLAFSIQAGTGYLPSAARGEAVVRISPLPLVGISAASTSIVGGGSSVITVSVNPPVAQNTMVVFFSVVRNNLVSSDFSISGGSSEITVSIPPGQSSAQIALNVPANSRANGSLVFSLESNSGYNVNSLAGSVAIRVSGRPQIGVSASQAQVTEGEVTTVTFSSDPAPLSELTVAYALSATGGPGGMADDFTLDVIGGGGSASATMVVIPAGSTITQVRFTAVDDMDATESVSVAIAANTDSPLSYTVNPVSSQVTLTIFPALPVITSSASGVVVVEGEQTTVTLRAEAAPTATSPVAVMLTFSDQSSGAVTAADFTVTVGGSTAASTLGTPITANVPLGGALDIVITAVDDADTSSEELGLEIATSSTYTSPSQPILITINPRLDEVGGLAATPNVGVAGQVTLNWTSPAANCTSLELAVSPPLAGGSPSTQICTAGAAQSLLVSNLVSGTAYTFTVTVLDSVGNRSRGVSATSTAP